MDAVTTKPLLSVKNFIACPECDLLLRITELRPGEQALCPRCRCQLARPHRHSIEVCLGLSIAGLIISIPAYTLPLLGMKLLGKSHSGLLWSGVAGLFQEGLWALAIVVFLASMAFPITHLLLTFFISVHLHVNKANRYLALCMAWLQHIEEWAMLEIYALGIIVACVKLSASADLIFGFGLYAFVVLLAITVVLAATLDAQFFWRKIAELS